MKNREPDKINNNGSEFWYDENGKLHNDNDFPAKISFWGSKFWYKHGKLHNDFGPAKIYFNGTKFWYIDGKLLSEEEFKQHKIKNFINEE